MLHRDHRTFGKHRSCKHPIHIPLVEWHCGKRSCHVNLVICVEGYSSFSSVGISFVSVLIFLIISFRSLALCQRKYLFMYIPFSFPFRWLLYVPIFGICSYLFASHEFIVRCLTRSE
ncbi:hypothetical protein L210DRAFT_2682447 [Boletus edulis BED1]|uniref:Uncharacterized protein n=1 Tax=Boletus edulis BED1 TaxID=1328754 RepID=A0AAD4BM15_BOLED|nr:hypothetical protein L210DRAFT_2682447 [Boletus edulis BED1]